MRGRARKHTKVAKVRKRKCQPKGVMYIVCCAALLASPHLAILRLGGGGGAQLRSSAAEQSAAASERAVYVSHLTPCPTAATST